MGLIRLANPSHAKSLSSFNKELPNMRAQRKDVACGAGLHPAAEWAEQPMPTRQRMNHILAWASRLESPVEFLTSVYTAKAPRLCGNTPHANSDERSYSASRVRSSFLACGVRCAGDKTVGASGARFFLSLIYLLREVSRRPGCC